MIFKGIDFSDFLSSHEEFHALVDGWGVVLCPFLLVVRGIREKLISEVENELHYFLFGGVLGVWAWIGIIALLTKYKRRH